MISDCLCGTADYMPHMMAQDTPDFTPTRLEALTRLSRFVPHAGSDYARRRNFDLGAGRHSGVSTLSPYLRHRLITEQEVVEATLGRFSQSSAEKFVQEVFWRTYWKGWLEQRPTVWDAYLGQVRGALDQVQTSAGLRSEWKAACLGETGIDCFDAWAHELVETGYLHNHARMWFASIWIFTLRLPWALGADFFLRHLLDGDPASNTLGWRWVAGLQTIGKTYLARADNIAKYTEGRFNPQGQLAGFAAPLEGPPHPDRQPILQGGAPQKGLRTGLLAHEDDLSLGFTLQDCDAVHTTLVVDAHQEMTPLTPSPLVTAFKSGATEDALTRYGDQLGEQAGSARTTDEIAAWTKAHGLEQIVTAFAPVGPTRSLLDQFERSTALPLVRVMRPYDARAWPYAKAGFFKFKAAIPTLIGQFES